jgi:hypothetical protein
MGLPTRTTKIVTRHSPACLQKPSNTPNLPDIPEFGGQRGGYRLIVSKAYDGLDGFDGLPTATCKEMAVDSLQRVTETNPSNPLNPFWRWCGNEFGKGAFGSRLCSAVWRGHDAQA